MSWVSWSHICTMYSKVPQGIIPAKFGGSHGCIQPSKTYAYLLFCGEDWYAPSENTKLYLLGGVSLLMLDHLNAKKPLRCTKGCFRVTHTYKGHQENGHQVPCTHGYDNNWWFVVEMPILEALILDFMVEESWKYWLFDHTELILSFPTNEVYH